MSMGLVKVINRGLGRRYFAIFFLSSHVLVSFLAYFVLIYRLVDNFDIFETFLGALLTFFVCVLFYMRLVDLRWPRTVSVLPVVGFFNLYQVADYIGYADVSRFNVFDFLVVFYYFMAIFLMFKKAK